MLKEVVSLEQRKCLLREYEDKPIGPGQLRAKVHYAAAKHGTEFTHFRGQDPFLENVFDEEYQLFRPSDEAKNKPIAPIPNTTTLSPGLTFPSLTPPNAN